MDGGRDLPDFRKNSAVQQKSSRSRATGKRSRNKQRGYGVGAVVVDSMLVSGVAVAVGNVVIVVSVVLVVAGVMVADGFTIVVVLSAGEAAGVTVSVRCSHAARRAAPAKTQIYFFI